MSALSAPTGPDPAGARAGGGPALWFYLGSSPGRIRSCSSIRAGRSTRDRSRSGWRRRAPRRWAALVATIGRVGRGPLAAALGFAVTLAPALGFVKRLSDALLVRRGPLRLSRERAGARARGRPGRDVAACPGGAVTGGARGRGLRRPHVGAGASPSRTRGTLCGTRSRRIPVPRSRTLNLGTRPIAPAEPRGARALRSRSRRRGPTPPTS